ncbi:MAG: hypothetical protein M3436_20295 [Pseudomonadota bacterium]|nr:hypothetical protein [Pseudomonadota bacterium]
MVAVAISNERGGILLMVLICLLVVIVLYFGLVVFLWVGVTNGTIGAGTQGQGSIAHINGNRPNIPLGHDGQSHTKANNIEELDSGSAELVCVRLNGVGGGKTPALDRRVARRMIGAINHLAEEGLAPLSFTWALRTTCQQRNVNPGPNLKARPGSSPHEAGSAVDVSGMSSRRDAGRIVQIMGTHDFIWLGRRDPPHFHVMPATIGEASFGAWIRKIQHLYQLGQPTGGCRGSECGS